jgi:putative ABC transport system ATP-binding protein
MGYSQQYLQISELSFNWPESKTDLLNIPGLTVERGESVFIQGKSGSGKSTLLNLITGVLPPSRGSITVLGRNLETEKKIDQYRVDHFGIIFQQFNLIPYLNVIENIVLPISFSARRKARLEVVHKSVTEEAG